MTFRPLPVLTLVAMPILAALIWLGVWQVQRAQWKAGLIADYETMAAAPPKPLDEALCPAKSDPARAIGQPIAANEVRAEMLPNAAPGYIRMFGENTRGSPGGY